MAYLRLLSHDFTILYCTYVKDVVNILLLKDETIESDCEKIVFMFVFSNIIDYA